MQIRPCLNEYREAGVLFFKTVKDQYLTQLQRMKRYIGKHTFRIPSASWINKGSAAACSHGAMIAGLFCVLLLASGCAHTTATINTKPPTPPAPVATPPPPPAPKTAEFGGERRSLEAKLVADWVVDSDDNHAMPFMLIDKTDAKAFLFEPGGRLIGAAPCLIGLQKGDVCDPNMGRKKLSQMRPSERITPAGRFDALLGPDLKGKTVFWVDYKGGVAMHWVVTNNPKERRPQRIASPDPAEHRISYGCINVPDTFYFNVIEPTFTGKRGVVYVLPEVESNEEAFKSYYRVEMKDGSEAR